MKATHPWVSHQAHVDVASDLEAIVHVARHAADELQQQRLDESFGGCDAFVKVRGGVKVPFI